MYCDVSLELLLLLSAVNIIISDQSSDDNEVEEVRRELRVMMAARKRPSDVIMEQLNDTYTQRYCTHYAEGEWGGELSRFRTFEVQSQLAA